VASPGDLYGQTRRCLEIIQTAIEDAGGKLEHVVRTRIFLKDMSRWEEAGRAHGEFFKNIRPASTMIRIVQAIDPDWLVEIEADAIVP
jgi:enamine deaminase RidA (YjgF/YER057c/UK114 family)